MVEIENYFLTVKVWANAAIQNFNSIGVAFGGLISMSSYNRINKKILGFVKNYACFNSQFHYVFMLFFVTATFSQ